MTLLVGVNSYVSLADAVAYMADRLYTDAWDSATSGQQEKALIMAATALDSQNWKGVITSDDQAMAWPRSGVYDREGREVDSATVPQPVKDAQAEIALAILAEDPADARDPAVKRMKAGSVEVEYRSALSAASAIRGAALPLVKPFLVDAGGSSARMIP